jgi:AcrR family transcriptional regulator
VARDAREQPKERLSPDRIVDAAMELMASKGYDAVSMRSLAAALDTGPASLYAHVQNREHLDQLVLDRIATQLTVPEADPERWAEQLKDLMREMLELYRAHPGSARAAMAIIPTESGSVRAIEGVLAICSAGGISPQAAAWFCDLAPAYVASTAVEELIWTERENSTGAGEVPDHEAIDAQLTEFFESLPAESFPLLTAQARFVTNGDGVDRFEFGIDVLVAGLSAVSARYA